MFENASSYNLLGCINPVADLMVMICENLMFMLSLQERLILTLYKRLRFELLTITNILRRRSSYVAEALGLCARVKTEIGVVKTSSFATIFVNSRIGLSMKVCFVGPLRYFFKSNE